MALTHLSAGRPTIPQTSQVSVASPASLDELGGALGPFNRGEFEKAEELLRALLEREPGNSKAAYQLVRALLLQDKLEESLAVANSVQGQIDTAWSHLTMADVDWRMGRLTEASVRYRAALERDDSLARAHFGLGRALKSEQRLSSAKAHFARALELDPLDPDILLAWAGTQPSNEETDGLLERYLALEGYQSPEERQAIRSFLNSRRGLADRRTFRLERTPESVTLPLIPKVDPREKKRAFRNGQPVPVNGFLIEARFNGGKKRRLLVDTGANGVTLWTSLAGKDKIRPLADVLMGGIGDEGMRTGSFALAETVSIGDLTYRNCVIRLLDKKHVGSGSDGIIGSDVFSDFLIKLNFPERTLKLTQNPDEACSGDCYEKDWVPTGEAAVYPRFRRISGKIFVQGTVNDSLSGQFMVDTGAGENALSIRAAQALGSGSSLPEVIRGVSGATKLQVLPEVTLQLAGVRQTNRDVVAFDTKWLSHTFGVELMGFAGHPLLQNLVLTINYQSGWIKLELP